MARRGGFQGGMPGNMNNLMKQAQKMQRQMEVTQKEMEEKEYEATAGGGAVTVKVSGKKEVLSVKLSEEVVDPDDIEMLEDLIVAATNEALRQLEEDSAKSMEALTGGHTALGQASKGFLVKFDSGHVGMVQRLIGRPAENPKSTRWRSKNGIVEKLYTMSSPSASAMHSTVWREEVEPDSEIILQERLQHEVSKILMQAGRKTK